MKNFLISEIENFLYFLEHNLGRGKTTIDTYRPILYSAMELLEVEKGIADLYAYRESIAKDSPKTIAKKLSAIRSYFDWIFAKGYKFHIKGVESIKTPKSLPKPVAHQRIMEAIDHSPDKLLLWLVYALGLRISEASNLQLKNISGNWVSITGKGNKTRHIPMLESLKDLIHQHIKQENPTTYLFEKNGKQMSAAQLRFRIDKSFKNIGLKVTPHQLRHSFATEMLNSGARITDVSELLGHSQLGTTEIYTKLSSSKKLHSYLSAHPLCKEDAK